MRRAARRSIWRILASTSTRASTSGGSSPRIARAGRGRIIWTAHRLYVHWPGLRLHLQGSLAEALDELRAGEYRNCLTCGDVIAPARLRATPEVTTCAPCHRGAETARALNRDDMRARVSRVGVAVGAVALSLGLLAACATSPPTVDSDRERDESACVRVSISFNDRGSTDLPFNIDRDAYRRCLAERGHHPSPSGIQAP